MNTKYFIKVEDKTNGEQSYFNTMLNDCMNFWNREGEKIIKANQTGELGDEKTQKDAREQEPDDFLLDCLLCDCKVFVNSHNNKAEEIIYETGRTRSHIWVHKNRERIFMFYIEQAKN